MSMDVGREAEVTASETGLTAWWELELDYVTVARFASLVVERGLPHASARNWSTERMTLDGTYPYALMTFRDRTEKAALLDLTAVVNDACLVHVSLQHETLYLRLASQHVDTLAEAETWLRELYPETEPEREQRVAVSFWANSAHNRRSTRTLEVPSWEQVRENYPHRVQEQLAGLLTGGFRPATSGQLVLWHGRPGTGKTSALRALAWEWREWCRLHYVTDPETFFGSNARYMLDLLLDEEDEELWPMRRASAAPAFTRSRSWYVGTGARGHRRAGRRVLHVVRQRRAGRRARRCVTTAARRASTHGWSSSAWCRTASRSPTRPTRGCSTSSASTRRRRS